MNCLAAITTEFAGFIAEGPMFWTLIALLGCLVYMRSAQQFAERQAKQEAENARRHEQTYQTMIQHYRQVAMEQQSRLDHQSQNHPNHRGAGGGSGTAVEAVQLLVESNMARSARLEARVEALTKELESLRREVAECEGTTSTLFSSVSDLHHKFNGLNHAVQGLAEVA